MLNTKKTKKQHYVPRCYLNRWANEKHQISVFDKLNISEWTTNVYDVASENWFYDINQAELREDVLNLLHQNGVVPEEDEQFIEHFFSEEVENEYAELLRQIVDKEITPWYEQNCFFISQENKFLMSICMVYQYIRTKSSRQSIINSSKCIEHFLRDINCDEEVIKRHTIQRQEEKIIQGNMFFDIDHVTELAEAFCSLTWILGINKTITPLFTSDHPIGTYPHIKESIVSMSGIGSRGVEAYFPLSPNHILIMFDADYHIGIKGHDRKYVLLTDKEDVERYNRLCAYNSGQYVFSNEPGFSLVKIMIKDNPNIFSLPKTTLSYGGKTYTSTRMEDCQ